MFDVFRNPPRMFGEAKRAAAGRIWIIELLIFLLVFYVITLVESIPLTIAMLSEVIKMISEGAGYSELLNYLLHDMPSWMMLITLFSTGIMTGGVILYCRLFEKRGVATLGFRRDGAVKEYAIGIVIALVMISAAAGLGVLTGSFSFKTAGAVSIPITVLYLLGFVVQGMAEEVLCRGYLMVSLARKSPVWLSVLLSSLVFAALHLTNEGISPLAFINLTLCGAVFAVYILKRGSIWGAAAMHSFWNFFQGNLYGISVSGTGWGEGASLFRATAADGAAIWNGGAFGIEGGLCDTFVELAALLIIIFLVPKKKNEFDIAEGQQ